MSKENMWPKRPQATTDDVPRRDESHDDDIDITAVIKGSRFSHHQKELSATSGRPMFGHSTQAASSLKQKASVFIQQKTRPEHHLGTKISGPRAPTHQDRRPRPMPVFRSSQPLVSAPLGRNEVFYTDPAQASADLKALLEGGMDEDADEDEFGGQREMMVEAANTSAERAENQDEKPKRSKKEAAVEDSGTVDGLTVRLLPHQVEGVNWMCGRELGPVKCGRVPKGGLLADDMGLGKTLQTVTTMLMNQKPEADDRRWKKHMEGVAKTTLIVAPLALIRQWESELKDKVAPSARLKVLVHHGPRRTQEAKELAHYDVVITTYQIVASEHGKWVDGPQGQQTGCFGLHWWRVVLDEAHMIKNRNAKTTKACYGLRCEYQWCLSGTPMQNNLDELQSLVHFLRIKPYDDLKQWKEHIDSPLRNGHGHLAIRRLHSLLRCFMKRRTKDILKEEGALVPGGKAAGPGQGSTTTGFRQMARNVVNVTATLSAAERTFYDRLEERADRSIKAMMKNKLNYANAFTLLLRLRQACNDPRLVEKALHKDKDALLTGDGGPKKHDVDVDAMADQLAGVSISVKRCSVCHKDLTNIDVGADRGFCSECYNDLECFKGQQERSDDERTRTSKMKKKKKRRERQGRRTGSKGESKLKSREEVNSEEDEDGDKGAESEEQGNRVAWRCGRNRQAVVDSDDDGRWLVPEDERGPLQLGKTGGSEDENAEGGGESIGSEDSADETDEASVDQSDLGSFVVDDETVADGSDSDDESSESLPSISAVTKKMQAQRLDDEDSKPGDGHRAAGAESGSGSSTSGSETESASSRSEDADRAPATSAKMRELQRLLRAEAGAHKFIVFSQFTSMLNLVEPLLRRDGLCFCRYDGSMRNEAREESLRRLRHDDGVRVLLCSLKCGSLGLNLTAATRVVIMEPFWNPFVEEQAIDRVHRLNQTADVTVYKLTVAQTVEARILDLQARKRELAEQTIEGGARKAALKLGLNELVDLFRTTTSAATPPPSADDIVAVPGLRSLAAPRRPRRRRGPSCRPMLAAGDSPSP